ncbi:flavin-dependent oxidoreductase [Paenarthrobacter sp. A20]|uniref:flavin-dependent oxidoreductase n=1 Tax=Paenarthrobacter sp. A20 TaxID=2817891 RepID=UPI0020A1A8E5|nr:flavin-dependent oxidoreductase [Paenarthrobacter sp. A20]MCP1415601.1 2-polyprenyl-6-methoxyphenol hydroxylase-like FAD-dependent oxidoreductase [Paenarthrobacter sp. A20]
MKIAIAGGGIGGLTTALMLHDAGIPVTIYEAVPEPRPLGVGINVLPHAVQELDRLGVLEELLPLAVATEELCYANRHGQFVWREPRGTGAGYAVPQLSIHRGNFQMALMDIVRRRLGESSIRNGLTVSGSNSSSDNAQFQLVNTVTGHTSEESADVLIGADGLHSALRKQLTPSDGSPSWSGELMWRGTTVAPPFLTGKSMALIGTRGHKVVAYPLSMPDSEGNALINWIAVLGKTSRELPPAESWNGPGDIEDFIHEFDSWSFPWLDVPELMRGAGAVHVFPMVDRNPLPTWNRGRTTLLGDAAHPMYPVGSNGASQAIIDARALTDALMEERTPDVALARYEHERLTATATVVRANRNQGSARILDLAEERAPEGFSDVNQVFAPGEREAIASEYQRVAGFTPANLTHP